MLQTIANIPTNIASALRIYQRSSRGSRLGPLGATLDEMLQLKRCAGQLRYRVTALVNAAIIDSRIAVAHQGNTTSGSGTNTSCSTRRQL